MTYFKHLEGRPAALRPRIGYYNEDGSTAEVYGHCCETFEQAHAYCKKFGFFIMNEEVPTEPTPLLEGPL